LATLQDLDDYIIAPDPSAVRLTRAVVGTDQNGAPVTAQVVEERPLTIFLNAQEIVTAMTIGDYPDYLALGFLKNQGMLAKGENITGVDYDEELETVVVRTASETTYEDKLKKKTRTSGCAVGTVFGDMMEGLAGVQLPDTPVKTSDLYALASKINRTPSLYLQAGAIHGTVLCQDARPLVYMEDVSEMVIKTALMGIPTLASRSGFTAWGVEIAQEVGLTLIGRMKGQRFTCLAGEKRLIRDAENLGVRGRDERGN